MTLGEFRKITEQYGDDCILQLAKNTVNISAPVSQIQITVDAATVDDQSPMPRIAIL